MLVLPDTTTDAELTLACKQTEAKVPANPSNVEPTLKKQAIACGAFDDAAKAVADSTAAYNWTLDWQTRRANVSDGQILFEMVCACCHTQGWSVFDPSAPADRRPTASTSSACRAAAAVPAAVSRSTCAAATTQRRFGTDEEGGWPKQVDFVSQGSRPNLPYGITGIGTGKMPGFGSMLTNDDIAKIVSYERYCLEATDYIGVTPVCDTPTKPRTPPSTTTTTTAAKAGG